MLRAVRALSPVVLASVVGAMAALAARARATRVDPPPPYGPPRVVELAAHVGRASPVLLDGDRVWFTRGDAADASLLVVPTAGGAERTVVAHARGIRLVGVDAANVYFTGTASVNVGGGAIDLDETLQRVPRAGGAVSQPGGPCSHGALLVDATGAYCPRTGKDQTEALARVDPVAGAVVWQAKVVHGALQLARSAGHLFVTGAVQRMGGCEGHLFDVDVGRGGWRELAQGWQCTATLAADASGAYAVLAPDSDVDGRGTHLELLRFPPSASAWPVSLGPLAASTLAVTPYHVVWRDPASGEVAMMPKAGGARVVLGAGARAAQAPLATDATGVVFTSSDDRLLRVEGID